MGQRESAGKTWCCDGEGYPWLFVRTPLVEGHDFGANLRDGRTITLHRADYQRVLYDATINAGVKVEFGKKVVGYDFYIPSLILEDGMRVSSDLIIAADGIASSILQDMPLAVMKSVLTSARNWLPYPTTSLPRFPRRTNSKLRSSSYSRVLSPRRITSPCASCHKAIQHNMVWPRAAYCSIHNPRDLPL